MYNIETLCEKTGMTRRNVHYYVQRGLLPAAEGGGRGAYYTDEHLTALQKIAAWSRQGVPLFQMRRWLSGEEEEDQTGSKTFEPVEVYIDKAIESYGTKLTESYRALLSEGIEIVISKQHFDRGTAELIRKRMETVIMEILS